MSLRAKLACALIAAALLPMAVALGTAMLRAGGRAARESASRAVTASRQAALLLDLRRRALRERMDHAAADLAHDYFGIESVLSEPGTSPSGPLARSLAGRHGLDHLEILGGEGQVVACSRLEHAPGSLSPFAALGDDEVVPTVPAALSLRTTLPVGNAPRTLAGSLALDERFLAEVSEITGAPASLGYGDPPAAGPAGASPVAEPARASHAAPAPDAIPVSVPLGSGLELLLAVPPADAADARRELATILGGLAPFAVACALAVALLLAQRISAPIRRLAARADGISRQRAGPLTLPDMRDEVRRLTLSFERMLDALQASEGQRLAAERVAAWQEIARRIAHEVKNPLSPIRLAVQNLLRTYEKDPGRFERALREEAATILEEVDSLRRLVDEFSQFARLPAPVRGPCDPAALVESTLALFAGRIEQLGVAVELRRDDPPAEIHADPELLGRALKNVVANALDAMEEAPAPRLVVTLRGDGGRRLADGPAGMEDDPSGTERAAARAGDGLGTGGPAPAARATTLEIRIADSGVGLSAESKRRLFEPYYTTRPDRGGSGLGLAIAHRIVTEHGGAIAAEGAPGRGATIVLRLPLGAADAPEAGGSPERQATAPDPPTASLSGESWPRS